MQPTERLFDNDPYMTEFSATVLCWKQAEGAFFAALDRTAFFPEGGGQFCDLGTLYNADVLDVREDESGVIWHKINKPVETGIIVSGRIDFRRRFDFMQQHSGQMRSRAGITRSSTAASIFFPDLRTGTLVQRMWAFTSERK